MLIFFIATVLANLECIDSPCTACSSQYFLYSQSCLATCPYGYTASGTVCTKSSSLEFFNECFDLFLTYKTSYIGNSFVTFSGELLTNQSKTSPVPTRDRGIYFENTSKAKSKELIVPAPDFTISIIFHILFPGVLMEARINSINFFVIAATTTQILITTNYTIANSSYSSVLSTNYDLKS